MKVTFFTFSVSIFLFFFFFRYSNAQTSPNLQISIETSRLSIGTEVKAIAKSSVLDLEGSAITWTHNGARVMSGRGAITYTFVLGETKKPDTLQLSVTSTDGQTTTVIKTIHPGKIHFTWYTDTYTPTWYRGKSLITSGTSVTIVAIPEFITGSASINPNDLIYTWDVDGRKIPVGAGSGRGKNSYTFTLSSVQNISYQVGVEIKNDANTFLIKENIPITAIAPQITFYERPPLDLLDKIALSIKTVSAGDSLTLEVEPFYTPNKALQNTTYLWSVNRQAISDSKTDDRIFQLSTRPENSGKQTIAVVLKNIKNILQTSSAELPVIIVKK